MGVYRLVALSDQAKGFKDGGRGPDLALWTTKPVFLGRAVNSRTDGFKLPPDWQQISAKHCTITAAGEGEDTAWTVEDTSTNGTFINGKVVGKGKTAVLKAGDKLSLSYVGSGHTGPAALAQGGLEWQLVYDPDGTPPPPASSTAKRRQVSAEPSAEPPDSLPRKRVKEHGDNQELLQLRQSNQELRKQNEQYRHDLDLRDQRAQAEQEAALARKQEQHEEELKKLQAQADQREEALQEENQAALQQLQEQMGTSVEQLEQAQKELAAAKAALEAEQSQTAELATRLAAAEEPQQQLQQELAANTEHLQQQLAAAQAAQAAASEAASALAAAREAAVAAQQDASAARAAAVEAQAQAAAAVQKKVAAEEAAQLGDRQLQAARRQLTALQEQLGGKKEHLLLQHNQFAQMQTSLAALTAEQQERSARMHQLMEQLQALAGDRDRAAAELLGAISEQVTALQQSTSEELQEVGVAGAADGEPDAPTGSGSQQEDRPEGAADMMMTQLASSEVMPAASGLGAAGDSGATAMVRDGAGGMADMQMETEGGEDGEAAAGMQDGSEAGPTSSEPADSAAAGTGSQQFPAATLQLLTGRQLAGTYGTSSLDWQPLTVPLQGHNSMPHSGAGASSHPVAAGGAPDLMLAAGPTASADGAAAAASSQAEEEAAAARGEDMEDPLEVHGATGHAPAAAAAAAAAAAVAAMQAPPAAVLAGTVVHGTESDEPGPTTQDNARLAAQQPAAVADAAPQEGARQGGDAAGGGAGGTAEVDDPQQQQQQQQEEEEEEEEAAFQQEGCHKGAAAGMLSAVVHPEAVHGARSTEEDVGVGEQQTAAAQQQQELCSQDGAGEEEVTEGYDDEDGEEEELQGENRQEEGLVQRLSCGGGVAGTPLPQRQPLGPVSQQLQEAGEPGEGLKVGSLGRQVATPPSQQGASENAYV